MATHFFLVNAVSDARVCKYVQSPYYLMPDVAYTFHVPHPPPAGASGTYGVIRVDVDAELVGVETFIGEDGDQSQLDSLDYMRWEEEIRARGVVITPLIDRAGVAVLVTETDEETVAEKRVLGCLVPPQDNDGRLLDATDCTYHALLTADMRTARIFFLEVLRECLLPVGEVLYLNMAVLEDAQFREQGRGGKVLFTRLDIPHVRCPEVGKLYVTCLHQPRRNRQCSSTRGSTAITLAVNPWDVQLASAYAGDPASVVKHLH